MTSIISNSLNLQAPNSFDTKKFEFGARSRPMSGRQTGGKYAATAIRIRALRRASQWPDRQVFADKVGLTYSQLSNFENGFVISNQAIDLILKKLPWISSDWLRYGREEALSAAVAQRLAPLVAEESDTTTPRSRSKGSATR